MYKNIKMYSKDCTLNWEMRLSFFILIIYLTIFNL
jgi:hypothetical protein